MNVHTLIAVTNPQFLRSCTFALETIRRGFPTAHITVWVNASSECKPEIREKAVAGNVSRVKWLHQTTTHAAWVRGMVCYHASSDPLIIVDPDTYWWKSVEDWDFGQSLMAGYYIPQIFNDFSKCVSVPRLHTSHLWFPNVPLLMQRVQSIYPPASAPLGECCPADPFLPTVQFIAGQPRFWDACANLYNMLGTEATAFSQKHLDCFEHLGSASAFDVMFDRLGQGRELFKLLHTQGLDQPEMLKKHLWPCVNAYYRRKEIEARLMIDGMSVPQ